MIEKFKTIQEDEKKKAQGKSLLTKEESYLLKSKIEAYEKTLKSKCMDTYKINKDRIEFIKHQRDADVVRYSFAYLDSQSKKVSLLRLDNMKYKYNEGMLDYFFVLELFGDFLLIYKSNSGIIELPRDIIIFKRNDSIEQYYALTTSDHEKTNNSSYWVRTYKLNATSTPK